MDRIEGFVTEQHGVGGGHGTGAELERAHGDGPPEPYSGGLPEHHPRRADIDPRAAKRVERQVALLFLIGMLTPIAFWLEYVYIPRDAVVRVPVIGETSASNFFLGLTMGIGLLAVGIGAIHWAKKLMPDIEEVGDRHPFRGSDEDRDTSVRLFDEGVEQSGFLRFKLIRRTMLGALAATPLFAIPLLKDLGPMPGNYLRYTLWKKGERIVSDVTYRPLTPADIAIGSLVDCVPQSLPAEEEASGNQDAAAKSPVILIRMRPSEIMKQQGKNWDVDGILCYSKICTHVGCPTSLYQQKTHLLLCPCHQSTFDLADAGRVVFGPAARAMPQLPITVDSEGYLVAQSDFHQPVGPSFWERG
jgi:ubiquinol-cytochrome c reductase iron-sulfur subunit